MKNQEQKTILLVEDDITTMMVETHLLKSIGYDVVTAKSGEEAVQVATCNDKIALILMDIRLSPGMDGAEAAKQILRKRHLPIVFLTAHTEKEYVERTKGIAGYGYVVKNSGDVVLQSSIEMAFNLFKAQAAMRESERELSVTLNATTSGIYKWNFKNNVLFFSSRYYTMLGYKPGEFPATYEAWKSLIHPDDLAGVLRVAEGYLVDKPDHYENEFRMRTKAGGYRWIHARSTVVERDERGNAVRIIGNHEDITERKKAEGEKRRLEERSHKLVDDVFRFIPEGILVFSRKMELLRQNQAFRALVSGYAKRLDFAEDELENLIIDKVKAGLRDNNLKEIRIARKHETGEQTRSKNR